MAHARGTVNPGTSDPPGNARFRTERRWVLRHAPQMDWNSVAQEWKAFRNEVRYQWVLLTDVQLETIAGQRARLAEQIRLSYGVAADEAERQILNFEARNRFLRPVSLR
jgi:uncharacterized protein YjbJ (UPF0337 family)